MLIKMCGQLVLFTNITLVLVDVDGERVRCIVMLLSDISAVDLFLTNENSDAFACAYCTRTAMLTRSHARVSLSCLCIALLCWRCTMMIRGNDVGLVGVCCRAVEGRLFVFDIDVVK